jgi:hypothetical protein
MRARGVKKENIDLLKKKKFVQRHSLQGLFSNQRDVFHDHDIMQNVINVINVLRFDLFSSEKASVQLS